MEYKGITRTSFIAALVVVAIVVITLGVFLSTASHQLPSTAIKTKTLTKTSTATITITKTKSITKLLKETSTITTTLERTKEIKTIIDALGRRFETIAEPRRIVCLAPSITEIVCALGLCDRIVGVDQFSNYPEYIVSAINEGKIIVIGGYWNPDVEKIAHLKPDIVLADAGVPSHSVVAKKLKELGIPVFFLLASKAKDLQDVESDIMRVAVLFNIDDKGKLLVENIERKIMNITNTIKTINITKPRVLLVFGTPEWGIYAAGGGTFIDYVIKAAGGFNTASKYFGWPMLSDEDVIAMNPTMIIIAGSGYPEKLFAAWNNTVLAKTSAYKQGRVCVLTGPATDAISRPGPRIADAIEILASLFYPNIFKEPLKYKDNITCLRQHSLQQ